MHKRIKEMGQTESLFNVPKDDWNNLILVALLVNYILSVTHIPIWRSPNVLKRYIRGRKKTRNLLLNPYIWYNGLIWWLLFVFGGGWGIYRMLKILRTSDAGDDTANIYHAEVALFIASIQLGVHGFWSTPFFYWGQAFWSIFIMAVATLVGIGAYIPMVMVDPVTSGITYGIYLLAHIAFVVGNTILFVKTYDRRKDAVKNPFSLYWNQQFNEDYAKKGQTKGNREKSTQ